MKTISTKLFIKEQKRKPGYGRIYLRIIYDRAKTEMSTGLSCRLSEWDDTEEKCINDVIQEELFKLQLEVLRMKSLMEARGEKISAQRIKEKIHNQEEGKNDPELLNFLRICIQRKEESQLSSKSTLLKYYQTLGYVEQFLLNNNIVSLRLSEINPELIDDFDHFLKTSPWNDKGDLMMESTRNKHHVRLKAMLEMARKQVKIRNNPYQNIKLRFPTRQRPYLSKTELQRIEELDFSNNPSLQKVKLLFLFSCYTGIRFSDAQKLIVSDIIEENGNSFIRLKQGKTQNILEMPLLDKAKGVLRLINESRALFRMNANQLLPEISNQKCNHYLKFIAELAGIKANLSHHIARHTFATTILLENDVPLEVVSHFLGHRSIRTTQIYAKITKGRLTQVSESLNDRLT